MGRARGRHARPSLGTRFGVGRLRGARWLRPLLVLRVRCRWAKLHLVGRFAGGRALVVGDAVFLISHGFTLSTALRAQTALAAGVQCAGGSQPSSTVGFQLEPTMGESSTQ